MKRQLRPILSAIALLCAPLAWSQSGFPNSTPGTYSSDPQQVVTTDSWQTQNGSDSSSQNGSDSSQSGAADLGQSGGDQSGLGGPQATFSHPEKLPPLNLFSDAVSHTGYSLSVTAGTAAQYITQPGLSSYWNIYSLFGGGLSIVQSRPTATWSLGYTAGYNNSASNVYSSYSNLNQSANGHILWNITKRWQFRLKDSYFYSDDPFQPFFTYLGQPTPNNPNPVYYFPQTVVEQNQATADLTYMLGAHDSIDFYGAESFQRYLRGLQSEGNLLSDASLWNSITYSGGAFYQHSFSAKLSAGEGYVFTAMDFGHGQSRAGVNLFQTFVNYKFSPRLTVSGWVGPELTNTKDIVPIECIPPYGCLVEVQHNSYFSVAEGGTVSWAAGHNNTMGAQFSHSVMNGGGVLGAVQFYQITATYSRPLNRNWGFGAGFNYGNSTSISSYQGKQYLYASQGTLSLNRQFNQAWRFNAYYAFIKQSQNYYGLTTLPISLTTNGVGVTLSYAWNHSLGR